MRSGTKAWRAWARPWAKPRTQARPISPLCCPELSIEAADQLQKAFCGVARRRLAIDQDQLVGDVMARIRAANSTTTRYKSASVSSAGPRRDVFPRLNHQLPAPARGRSSMTEAESGPRWESRQPAVPEEASAGAAAPAPAPGATVPVRPTCRRRRDLGHAVCPSRHSRRHTGSDARVSPAAWPIHIRGRARRRPGRCSLDTAAPHGMPSPASARTDIPDREGWDRISRNTSWRVASSHGRAACAADEAHILVSRE